jgi:hypothetical protein
MTIYIGGAKCKDAQEGSDCFNSFTENCPGGNILPSYETDCRCALNHKGGRCCVSKRSHYTTDGTNGAGTAYNS